MIYTATTRLAEAAMRLRAAGGNAVWRERLVLDSPPARADIWLHAASVGEVNSAQALIAALAADHRVLVTTNSETGRARARQMGLTARLAPFDAPGALGRFLDAVRPAVQVTVEAELWPNRSRLLATRGIAQVVVGARMSDRSARRWGRLRGVIGPMLARIDALSAQDQDSEARLRALGLPDAAVLPRLDLKLLGPAAQPATPPSDDRDRTVLAASTHEGEDAPIIDAWLAATQGRAGQRLIVAPRHPQRGDTIAALLTARGVDFARRSTGGGEAAQVLLADTLGEMGRWYARAGICITGGSLTDRGGHTPWEPASHRCAILHGPDVGNFADSYRRLDAAGAARGVHGAALARDLAALLDDPATARAMGDAARAMLDAAAGDPAALLARIGDLAKAAPNPDIEGDFRGKRA